MWAYSNSRWRRERAAFLAAHPLCVCGREKATAVDHVVGINDGGSMWDKSNWQPMGTACHNRKSAKERHARNRGPVEEKCMHGYGKGKCLACSGGGNDNG